MASSGGFWVYLRHKQQQKDANTRLIMGLAHDRIVQLGMMYIENGFVTKDQYDDLIRYFYEPYMALGGDGTAKRIMMLVQLLPLTLTQEKGMIANAVQRGAENVVKKLQEEGDTFDRRTKPRRYE